MSGEPDRDVGQKHVRAVFRQDRDRGTGRKIERSEVRGHPSRFVHGLSERKGSDRATVERLGQIDAVSAFLFPPIQTLEE